MSLVTPKQITEALLMASPEPLSAERLLKILNQVNEEIDLKLVRDTLSELVQDYQESGIELKEVASGWRFQIKSDLSQWVNKLYEERPPKYSRALLEILALVAYRQPITRAEVEDIRGVAVSSNIIKTLLEHEWIKVVGNKEVPGRPALYATTKKFLDHFNLKHLDELPPLIEFTETLAENADGEIKVKVADEKETTGEESNGSGDTGLLEEEKVELYDETALTISEEINEADS